MIEFEIDNQKVQGEQDETVIQVADRAGIYIPRFCYHDKLSIAANCRMCLVEVEKARKPMPACAMPIAPDMKVYTRSKVAIEAQRSVMEFLLINHPLDCPICDQGGECELQDLSMGYGEGISRFTEGKRSVADEDLGPLVDTFMTRCIHCTRCVRFGEEVAGMPELGATQRGEDMEIGTYIGKAMASELSGNVIDLCPVGALTSKPFRHRARAWELYQSPGISPHDCVGSNLVFHTAWKEYAPIGEVKRVIPRHNEAINETWLSDRDRFSYEALYSKHRLGEPLVKQQGQWQTCDWKTALQAARDGFRHIVQQESPQAIGGLISSTATLEECYLFQQLLRGLGSQNIDHRVRQWDVSEATYPGNYPGISLSLADIENQDTILLIGSNIRFDQPLACHRVRKAWLKGAEVIAINPVDYQFNFKLHDKCIAGLSDMVPVLAGLLKALNERMRTHALTLPSAFDQVEVDASIKRLAKAFQKKKKTLLLMGPQALNHPQAGSIRGLVLGLAQLLEADFGELTEGPNTAGAWLAGALPHRGPGGQNIDEPGLPAKGMVEQSLSGYLVNGIEPEFDCAYPESALKALKQAQHTVVLTSFVTETMRDYADIILPMSGFAENEGTYVNIEGEWQSFQAACQPYQQSKPAWKILRVLGKWLDCKGFEAYKSIQDVSQQLTSEVREARHYEWPQISLPKSIEAYQPEGLIRIADWPLYRVDATVRYASSLQATIPEDARSVRIHPETAEKLQLNVSEGHPVTVNQHQQTITLPLVIDARIPKNHAWVPPGFDETAGFGESAGAVELKIP